MSNLIPRLEFLLQSLFREQKFCPHCHSKDFKTIAKKYSLIKVQQCCSCDLCFVSPIYKPLIISQLYDNLYAAEGFTTRLPSSDELAVLKKNLFQSSDKCFVNRIQAISKLTPGRKMLEIGSSWGYFLYQAKQQGFEVTGLELSKPRRLFGIENLGVDICESINEIEGKVFDVVYTAHTLEHFTDLSTIFKDIYLLLDKKGLLLIEVPNFDYEVLEKQALSIIGAVHPLGLNSKFFRKNLPHYGFNVLGIYHSWDSFTQQSREEIQKDVIIVMAEKVS